MADFLIDDLVRSRARDLIEYASHRDNWCLSCASAGPDDPRHKISCGDVTATLVFVFHEGRLYRRLEAFVSKRYPPPEFVWTLARLLGFTTPDPDSDGIVRRPNDKWTAVGPNTERRCIYVLEETRNEYLH